MTLSPEPSHDVLIVGASGLVGSELLRRFGERAVGTYSSKPREGLVRLDVRDGAGVMALVTDLRPRIIVHTAAATDVNRCELEPEHSHAINVMGTQHVARAAAAIGARYLFFSTDYVFGGDHGPHRVDEPIAPVNVYGRHKAEAEAIVAATVPDHLIVRACSLYGYQPGGRNFVMTVYERCKAGQSMRVPFDQWGSPTLADDIATATMLAADAELRGAIHIAGPDYVDRLTLAGRAAAAFGLDARLVSGVPTVELGQAAPRPLKAGLDASETEKLLGHRFVALDAGLVMMRAALSLAGLL